MAASHTLPHFPGLGKSPISRSGVLTIYGFGVRVRMQAGHLEIEDGIGPDRRNLRLARVGHGLKRLVLVGSDGFITLEALHWLTGQDVAFVMLERDGKARCVVGPVHSSDARLRRAQALAGQSEIGIGIARELIDKKLAGQEQVARHKLLSDATADTISRYRAELPNATTLERIRLVESRAAVAYWSVWRNLPISFPKKDEPRVPGHWRAFGARFSPLTGSPRLAVNPVNAILNYLYGLLHSESRLAAAALGLDPGLGVLHLDIAARDSLACDLMEAVRPQVDAYLLDWITRDPLKREWFSERPDGNCRLTASFAARLSETASLWGRAVAPVAEWLAQTLWSSPRRNLAGNQILPTRLTQTRKRCAQGGAAQSVATQPHHRENICRECGKAIQHGNTRCGSCRIETATRRMAMLPGLDASLLTVLKRKESGAILNVAMPSRGIPGKHQANRHGSHDNSILRRSSRFSHKCRAPLLQKQLVRHAHTEAAFARATARIHGIGRHWRSLRESLQTRKLVAFFQLNQILLGLFTSRSLHFSGYVLCVLPREFFD